MLIINARRKSGKSHMEMIEHFLMLYRANLISYKRLKELFPNLKMSKKELDEWIKEHSDENSK